MRTGITVLGLAMLFASLMTYLRRYLATHFASCVICKCQPHQPYGYGVDGWLSRYEYICETCADSPQGHNWLMQPERLDDEPKRRDS